MRAEASLRPCWMCAQCWSWPMIFPAYADRLFWVDWNISPQEELVDEGSFRWKLPDVRVPHVHWVEPAWTHLGTESLPTLTRALPRARPPLQPAGIAAASSQAIARWQQVRFQFQVYQYEDQHLLWQGASWRLPTLSF